MVKERSAKHSNGPWPNFRFNLEEVAGAVGDYSTLFPILVSAAMVANLNLGFILLCFSAWYIISGVYYKLPVPVEPMKVVGAVVIAEGLGQGEIVATGIILGLLFLFLGYKKSFKRLKNLIPKEVIRGIQLGLAFILFKTSFQFVWSDKLWALAGLFLIAFFYFSKKRLSWPDLSALVLLGLGVAVACFRTGWPEFTFPRFPGFIIPTFDDFLIGGWSLVLPQIPLTMTNAILATSLLFSDLLDRDVDPDKLSKTIGWMNLTVSPFGGFPMCHGAGGLAAQYRFGARTGMSNIISGVFLIPIVLFFSQPGFLQAIPPGLFGALLVFIALEMGKHGLKTKSRPLVFSMAVVALIGNITWAFFVGMAFVWWRKRSA